MTQRVPARECYLTEAEMALLLRLLDECAPPATTAATAAKPKRRDAAHEAA